MGVLRVPCRGTWGDPGEGHGAFRGGGPGVASWKVPEGRVSRKGPENPGGIPGTEPNREDGRRHGLKLGGVTTGRGEVQGAPCGGWVSQKDLGQSQRV